MSDLTSPLGGDDLAKALRDACGWGYAYRSNRAAHAVQDYLAYDAQRDAWIAQYMARLPAAEPIAAASEPRVGQECCIPDAGEPSFVLLGRDPQAPDLVERWAADRELYEPDSEKPEMARAIAERMRAYKKANPYKGLQVVYTRGHVWKGPGRWETGLRNIVTILRGARSEFEIPDIVEEIRRLKDASAPSPEAGAGGDLGELDRLSKAATQGEWTLPHLSMDIRSGRATVAMASPRGDGNGLNDRAFIAALVNAYRSGKLVVSTEREGEKSGASASQTGLLPDGPTASRSSGFAAAIPSRDALHQLCWSEMPKYGLMSFEQLSEAVSEVMVADRYYKRALPLTECFIGHEVVSINFNSLNRIVTAFVTAALGTEARSAETFGLGPKDDGPAPQGATPEPSPSHPQMTVEEARGVLDSLDPLSGSPRTQAAWHRDRADILAGSELSDIHFRTALSIELALRTLQASGEVR